MVTICNLTFNWTGKEPAMLDFHVPDRGWHTILAPSGAGKTAAGASLAGLTAALGDIHFLIDNKPVEKMLPLERAKAVAIIPSQPEWALSLMGTTVEDELDLACGMMGEDAQIETKRWVITRLELHKLIHQSLRTLSGGEKVRAVLAAALMRRPKVIILDQALDACDPLSQRTLENVIGEWLTTSSGVLIEFATSWHNRNPPGCSVGLSALTNNGWISGTVDDVWVQSQKAATPQYFNGVEGLVLRARREKIFSSLHSALEWLVTTVPTQTESPPSPTTITPESSYALVVNNLCFSYGTGLFSLNDISFQLPRQSVTALIGANGSGKTTLLGCLANIIGPFSGCRQVNNHVIPSGTPPYAVAPHMIYAFQNPDDQIYRATVSEELLESRRKLRPAAGPLSRHELEICESLSFTETDTGKPFGISLSRRRLLTIASALLSGSAVVLLDEPTAYLDSLQKVQLALAIRSYVNSGGTVLMISHDMDFVGSQADRLIAMDQGCIRHEIDRPWIPSPGPPITTPTAEASKRAGWPVLFWREANFLSLLQP